MRVFFLVAAAITATPAVAEQDWFNMRPADALSGIRRNIDRLEALAPLPDPKCGRRNITTFCNAKVTNSVKFQLVETPADRSRAGFDAFFAGAPGAVLDVSVVYDPQSGTKSDGAIMDALCIASLLTFHSRLSPSAAAQIYQTTLRRAFNATATARGGLGRSYAKIPKGSLMVEADSLSIRCVVAGNDQRAIYEN